MGESNRFAQHGRVICRRGTTHLFHEDGEPFFYFADTAWNGALLACERDWDRYLAQRASQGFTAIQFISHAPWSGCLHDENGRVSLHANGGINQAFYDRMDDRIRAINAYGMLAVPVLAWAANFGTSGRLNIGHAGDEGSLASLIAYQVNRFKNYQVMWILNGDGTYGWWASRKWKRIGRAVFGGSNDSPVALHPMGMTWPYGYFANENWLGVLGYQSSHTEHEKMLKWWLGGGPARPADRPVINLEPVYEQIAPGGTAFDEHAVRRAIWRSLFANNIAGVAYGAHGVWGWHRRAEEALNHVGMGIGKPWHEAMNLPGAIESAAAVNWMRRLDWTKLSPAQQAFKRIGRDRRWATTPLAMQLDDDLLLVYFPANCEIELSDAWRARPKSWRNVSSGEVLPCDGRLVPPDERDGLLVVGELSKAMS